VYPALAVLQALTKRRTDPAIEGQEPTAQLGPSFSAESLEVLWVGGVGGMEENLVERAGVPFRAVPAAGVHGVGLRTLPGNLLQLGRGFTTSRRIIRGFRPDVLFFTGGYIAVPLALAARSPIPNLKRPRSLLYVPDIEPGLAIKTVARFADQIAATVSETSEWLPHRANLIVTGYPLRKDMRVWESDEARRYFDIQPGLPVLLVFGGSKGARSLNQALLKVLPELLVEMQVIHLSGQLDWPEVEEYRAELPGESASRYHAFPYLHEEMAAALSVADLVISRAGASVLGELPFFGLPAVLVPYPHAWRYQKVNAGYLAKRGAAVIVEDEAIANTLLNVVRELMRSGQRREQMRRAMKSLAHPQAADCIASLLEGLAENSPREGC
jgi:UDP-N-acetylglucosamine--N-acetylmuramyl-(pentapeptide) pyrophosphoryl-undecaprenol N-acetylglucosamine transferase